MLFFVFYLSSQWIILPLATQTIKVLPRLFRVIQTFLVCLSETEVVRMRNIQYTYPKW